MNMPRLLRITSALLLAVTLSACGDKVELHRQLSEQEANEVIAALADKYIQSQKVSGKDGVSVQVSATDINRAVRTLEAVGLPRRARATLGDTFRKEGVISTPLEERARYIYALSQELEATLSNIDGVIVARVHVVLPERVAPGEPVQPASASVFSKHDTRLDPDNVMPRIRRMVASSIPGMTTAEGNTQKLSVVFLPAAVYQEQKRMRYLGPFLVPADELTLWRTVGILSLAGLMIPIIVALFWIRRLQRLLQSASHAAPGDANG